MYALRIYDNVIPLYMGTMNMCNKFSYARMFR